MKKIFLLVFCFLGSALSAYPQCTPELASQLKKIYQFEEGRVLLAQAEATGPIIIKSGKLGLHASNAAWYPDERTIIINFSKKRSEGSLICSLIFELNNAASQQQFDHLDTLAVQNNISKRTYIDAVEHLEYNSALKTVQILKKGVSSHIFPSDAHYAIAPNFEEHYRVQREAGHSTFIGNLYDDLVRSYRSK